MFEVAHVASGDVFWERGCHRDAMLFGILHEYLHRQGLMYLSGSFGLSHTWDPLVLLFGSLITSTDPVTVLSVFHDIGT